MCINFQERLMFGYVKPQSAELLVKEYEFYKATYCGICRAMKKHIGKTAPMTITYDSVFLALIRMLQVEDSDIGVRRSRCIAHPIKSRPMLKINPAIEYTAKAFAILTYYKALDDRSDEKGMRRFAVGLCKPALNTHRRRADIELLDRVCAEKLSAIADIEKSGEQTLDKPARLFGELLAEIFSFGLSGSDKIVYSEVGIHLGKFIYLADAAEDYDKDIKEGKFNPYANIYDNQPLTRENRETIKTGLLLECRELERAIDLMPFGNRATIENIIRNIIYLGLPARIKFLDEEQKAISKEKEN
jgi:hypothetical protein